MSDEKGMTIYLKVWRQKRGEKKGQLVGYTMHDISPHASFLEMLDLLNDDLIKKGEEPIEFDSDCREGICGTCGQVVNGVAHTPQKAIATCQSHMRRYKDGDTITVEPFRSRAFPIIKDLVIDRSAFDRIIAKGGYTSICSGSAPDANNLPIPKDKAELAMDAAACIGCGACVAACHNGSASLFVGAKVSQYTFLPQGKPEQARRALQMVEQMDSEGFGDCSNHGECEAVCPKTISISHIARLRREYFKGFIKQR